MRVAAQVHVTSDPRSCDHEPFRTSFDDVADDYDAVRPSTRASFGSASPTTAGGARGVNALASPRRLRSPGAGSGRKRCSKSS
jgi:hypothetical protein